MSADFPAGAIENGRTHLYRLIAHYAFTCEAGSLENCADYQEAVRCFEHMAECLAALSVNPEAGVERVANAIANADLDGPDPEDYWTHLARAAIAALHGRSEGSGEALAEVVERIERLVMFERDQGNDVTADELDDIATVIEGLTGSGATCNDSLQVGE